MYGLPKSVCCACVPSVHLDAPSICYVVIVYVGTSFKSLRDGSHVFSLFMLFLCVILHNMWLLCILPLGILWLSAIRMMFVKNYWQCVSWLV